MLYRTLLLNYWARTRVQRNVIEICANIMYPEQFIHGVRTSWSTAYSFSAFKSRMLSLTCAFFFCCSCTKRSSAPDAAGGARPTWPVRAGQRRPLRWPQQPSLPLLLHLSAPPSGALPHLPVRPVRPACQRHGNRQYLRTSREATLLRRRMGAEHPLLPRTPSDRPGRVVKTRLVGAVRPERISVFHAPPRGATPGGRGTPRVADGGRPSRGVHGPHQDLPRASGEAESAPRRLGGVFLSEGHRPLHDR